MTTRLYILSIFFPVMKTVITGNEWLLEKKQLFPVKPETSGGSCAVLCCLGGGVVITGAVDFSISSRRKP